MKAPLSLAAAALTLLVSTAQARVIVDMRGKAVTVPDNPVSVATIDDGFIEGVMTHLGVINRVKVIGSWSMKRDYRYTIPSRSGESREYRGWNTMKYLHPWLDDLPCVNSPQGNIISYETLALAAPDVVLLRGLSGVKTALSLGRATLANIRLSLFWAFAYNVLLVPVAAGVLLLFGGPAMSPMLAGAAMSLSSVSVVLNALRLRRFH